MLLGKVQKNNRYTRVKEKMIITGKHIFYVVYRFNLIFHTLFIGYQLMQHKSLDINYLIVASTSVVATTLIFATTKKG